MTQEVELLESLRPQLEAVKTAVDQLPTKTSLVDLDRASMDITHQLYDICRAILDAQISRNLANRLSRPAPKPIIPRPTLEDIL